MADITHEHLDTLANRIESTVQRDHDQLRSEMSLRSKTLHSRLDELKLDMSKISDAIRQQNGRIGKAETRISINAWSIRVMAAVATLLFMEIIRRFML
jgi:ABC-type phosphate transport system auxiliary subunit